MSIDKTKKYFRQRIPNFVSGYDAFEVNVDGIHDVLNIEWVKKWESDPEFHCWALGSDGHLMFMAKYNSSTDKCEYWWCVGTLYGFDSSDIMLPNADDLRSR